eukprot:Skav221896  [mRNA]  locus=scaffold1395:707190:712031:+ [translate_table: standard]
MWAILLLSIQLRIGEAEHPGPNASSDFITIGAINPTGLLHKGSSIPSLPGTDASIWGVSETQLSAPGIRRFKDELRYHAKSFSMFHSAPAPLRTHSFGAIAGKPVGTAFVTNVPSRSLAPSWTREDWNQSRFALNTFLVHQHWVHGAVLYGKAHLAESQAVKDETNRLLQILVDRLATQMQGKRFIMGDFNQLDGSLPATKFLYDQGWREIQDLHHSKTGQAPLPTCKGKTRKDFVWLSPELVQFHVSTFVHPTTFKDHAVLGAFFHRFGSPEQVPLWRQPKPFDWDNIRTLPVGSFKADPSERRPCQSIAKEFEARVRQQAKVPITPLQLGRSATLTTVNMPEYSRPAPVGRHGDRAPLFHGTSLRYNQWFKQLRRLEAYARGNPDVLLNPTQLAHRHREWRAIRHASGFPAGFVAWWSSYHLKPPLVPEHLPVEPLDLGAARVLRDTFEQAFRSLEQTLINELQTKARANRAADPNKVFQDVRKPRVSPVQMLEEMEQATVIAINAEDSAIEFSPLGALAKEVPIAHSQGEIAVIQKTEDTLYVEDVSLFSVGDKLTQHEPIGHLAALFEKFGSAWSARWDKHKHTPDSKWSDMERFLETAFPPTPPWTYQPITYEQWIANLKLKRTKSAAGPDGWSRADLLQLPQDLTQGILDVINKVECGLEWPEEMRTGIIHALEKHSQASSVNDYRPITVYSLIYRNWSSIRSKEALKHFLSHMPSECYGNAPGRTAQDVWYTIQMRLEDHYFTGIHLSGCMLDLVKCFNHLPRKVLLLTCARLGMPREILSAWHSFLGCMTRRFHIRGGTGPAMPSSAGFPEGCGLSVVAMCACNILADRWLHHHVDQTSLITYVDNWELVSTSAVHLTQAFLAIQSFVQAMDLLIDDKKTFFWSTEPQARARFKDQNRKLEAYSRDLGGHVQYSRQTTNAVITQKIDSFQERWVWFARSHASRAQKLRAVVSSAWPNVLHAVSSVHLGDQHLAHLRTAVARCTKDAKPGTSPSLVLSLFEHVRHDPGYWALLNTVKDFRAHTTFEYGAIILDDLNAADRKRPKPGPCSVLLERLHAVGWRWLSHTFVDQWDMPIDLWGCCFQELSIRLSEAWHMHISALHSHRQTFTGMENTHVAITKRTVPPEGTQRSILRRNMTGTFLTADHLTHRDPSKTDACQFCGQHDSQEHRIWHCPALESARASCPPEVRREVLDMPLAVRCHGWFPIPRSLLPFRKYLLTEVPDSTRSFSWPPLMPAFLDLFTDGACHNANCVFSRVVSWGLSLASNPNCFAPIASGVTPGFVQTINRGELTAAIAAFRFAIQAQKPFRLWTDSQYVIGVFARFAQRFSVGNILNRVNHDLIEQAFELWQQASHLFQGSFKVMSHQDHATLVGCEAWVCEGNDHADAVAKSALANHPRLLELSDRLRKELDHLHHLSLHTHNMMIAVGELAISLTKSVTLPDPSVELPPERVQMQPWKFPSELPPGTERFFIPEWDTLHRWNESLHEAGDTYRWSWYQLYTDFFLETNLRGPWYSHATKRWEGQLTFPSDTNFVKRCRWFTTFFGNLAKALHQPLPVTYCKPDCPLLGFWINTLTVTVSPARHRRVLEWMQQWSSSYYISKDLQQIP